MAPGPLRFYLTGRVAIEGARGVDHSALRGPQARLTLTYLVLHRRRPIPVDELARGLWGDQLPPSWESSLRAIVSRLRTLLAEVDAAAGIVSEAGCYQPDLGACLVDIEVAANAIDRAEGAWRRGDRSLAWSEATVAAAIAGREVLPGLDLPWVADLRSEVRATWIRALDVLVDGYLADGQYALAVALARRLIGAEPYRESGYRSLMRAQLELGNRGEAVAIYTELRRLLADELGVDADPATERLYLDALRGGGVTATE
ncbi:AfsR/SARP family transcriptional regulator [Nitriliruptor alkaliphilus]|uniref:AfsR/SARP family transcriptional regulator n=1 Tax=Nitriliruptor alkaliphilus TaxID=427918 RepID=UPI000696C5C3|nr:BTAD domain-containing putative transcriptional regulator [Nitriliruptor alkaliphilus]